MHTGNNMADTVSSTPSYSSPIHKNAPILPSQLPPQQQPSGRIPNDNTLSEGMGHYRRRRQNNGSTGDSGGSSSASRASPVAQHPLYSSSVDTASSKLPSRGVRVAAPASKASSSTAATAVKAKRKRSMIACRNCNERRVRCDGSITGLPCTTCKSAGRTDCAFIDSKRVRGKRGRFESRDKAGSRSETQPLNTPGDEGPNRPQSMALTRSPRVTPASITQSLPYAMFPPSTSQSGFNPNVPYTSQIRSPMDNHIQVSGGRRQSSITENDIWRRLFESQPGVPQTQRITYVGEAWHLSWVLHQKTGSAPLHFASPVVDDSPETLPGRGIGSADFPLDKPDPDNSCFTQMVSEIAGSNSQAAYAVQASIDAFAVPPAPIRDALIKAYFSRFHPFFPILSTERFESHLNSSMTNKSPSLLLLQSMLMIGAMHCPLSLLTSPLSGHTDWKPFSNRSTAIETLVHRARMLFSIDHEKDRLSVIQSMFLLQFWWRIPGEYKDQSYWVAGALRIAQSMGLHRSTRESWAKGILDEQEQMLWRRMWWALYIRDRQIAAAMGKPVLIQDEDCDVEGLSLQDFPTEPKETALYMIESVKLIRVLHEILRCEFTPVPKAADGGSLLPSDRALRRERCQRMLEDWQRALPPELGGGQMVTTGNLEATAGNRQFYKRLMQLIFKIYFQSYELLLHRPLFDKGSVPSSTTSSGSGGTTEGGPFANAPTSSRQTPAPIASHAAKMITQHGREVYAICNRDVRYLPLNYVSFLFAALSVQLVELKSIDIEKERMLRNDVNFNLFFLENLAEMYPIAGWCRKLLVKILNETEAGEGVAQHQDVTDKSRVPGSSGSQEGVKGIDESHLRSIQRDMPSLNTNFGPENQYPQQRQDSDLHHLTETTYESVPTVSESAYRNFQNAHPHYNPHHAYHNLNFYQLPPSPENGSDGYSHASGSQRGLGGDIVQPPVAPAYNPFGMPSLQANSSRIRSMDLRYIDPSPTESPCPVPMSMTTSAIAMPTISVNAPSSVQERGKQRLSERWAGDVLLDTNLLHAATGAQDSSQRQQESDSLRYHVMQEEHGTRLVEETLDDDDDEEEEEEEEEDGLHGEDDRRSVLQAAAAAVAAVSGRQRFGSSVASGSGENVKIRDEGRLPADVAVAGPEQGRPRLHHTHTHPGAPTAYDNQWVFDGAGVLLGNPFLIGSNTDAYENPVGGSVSAGAHDPQHVPVSQGAYHHGIQYHIQHGH